MNRYGAGQIYPLLMYRKLSDVSRDFISGTYIACMIIHKILWLESIKVNRLNIEQKCLLGDKQLLPRRASSYKG